MKLNLGIRRRLAPLLDNDRQRWILINALFLSLPGTPIVYYGDEIGMGDNIWLPDRHGVRTPMQWSAAPNAGFSTAAQTYLPVIDDPVFGYRAVNVEAQENDPGSYLALTRHLIGARRERPALRGGAMSWVETGDAAVLAFARSEGKDDVLCVFNLSDAPRSLGFPLPHDRVDVLARAGSRYGRGTIPVLEPYAALWLRAAEESEEPSDE
jgi:maltose alpha-D-glucosyltransferase/alpha-amylase